MQLRDELVHRERETAPSERALFLERQEGKKSSRLQMEFTEGERAETRLWVPRNRIYGPWSEVERLDAYMAWLERLWADDDATDVETSAVEDVYRLLPKDVGEMVWKPVH